MLHGEPLVAPRRDERALPGSERSGRGVLLQADLDGGSSKPPHDHNLPFRYIRSTHPREEEVGHARRSVGSMLSPHRLRRLPIARRWPWLFALALTTGCTQTQTDVRDALARRIAPEDVSEARRGPRERAMGAGRTDDGGCEGAAHGSLAAGGRTRGTAGGQRRGPICLPPSKGQSRRRAWPRRVRPGPPLPRIPMPPSSTPSPRPAGRGPCPRPSAWPSATSRGCAPSSRASRKPGGGRKSRPRRSSPSWGAPTAWAGSTWVWEASRSGSAGNRRPGSTSSRPSGPYPSA